MAFWTKLLGFGAEVAADATLIKGVPALWNWLKKTHSDLPDSVKQRLPGLLGYDLTDEQLYGSVLGQLQPREQVVISTFLAQCKDYERNRFINVVAGMEVIDEGKIDEKKESFDDNGKKVVETKSGSKGKKDKRQAFLESFARIITEEFNGDFDKAYTHCIAGRMIIPDPLHQRALRSFSEGAAWFKAVILAPFDATSTADLLQKAKSGLSQNSANLDASTQSFEDRGKAFYERSKNKK
ncbi:MAG: hypothetical protein WCO05_04200 [Candidatus Moraniibacteriota bacterium]|jgi:hypothetical protein